MAKIILSPLFISLLVLWLVLIWQLCKNWRQGAWRRIVFAGSIIAVFILNVASIRITNNLLFRGLGLDSIYEYSCPVDAVVVLSAGVKIGNNRGLDQLNGESMLRVAKGAEVFKRCGAERLVLSGGGRWGDKNIHTTLMKAFALRFGVLESQIILEPDSMNTREHAINLSKMDGFDLGAKLAIVTSPWHLRRSMIEFRKYFPNSVPVAAYFQPTEESFSLGDWLPRAEFLLESTWMIHEYIGIGWYKVLNWWS